METREYFEKIMWTTTKIERDVACDVTMFAIFEDGTDVEVIKTFQAVA